MARLVSKKYLQHFWSEEQGLFSMFILLCISNFLIVPFFAKGQALHLIVRAFWFLLLFAGIATLTKTRLQMWRLSIFPIALVVTNICLEFIQYNFLIYIDLAVTIAVLALLISMVLVKVLEGGSVTIHRIVGAIVVYMLLGDLWATLFQFLYDYVPGSFQIPAIYTDSGVGPSVFQYFSYTTLTTTGYGDILPVGTIARTLVIIEQLVGVLYPVVLIGRLVSLVGTKNQN